MNDAIHLSNIEFKYPSSARNTLVLEDFRIQKGEKVFLYGPSGCGKSTLLEILAGVLSPQKGEVQILEKDLSQMNALQRDAFRAAHIGYIFQGFNLIPYLNVYENIVLPLHLSPERAQKIESDKIEKEVKRITNLLGIETFLYRQVTALSVGQQQRVAVARALLGAPEIILADEPTSSLDYDHRERFIRLLFDLCREKGITVLFVSHDRSLEKLFTRSLSLPEINKMVSL